MALHTKIQISIGDETLNVVHSFRLTERVGEHTEFRVTVEGKHLTEGDEEDATTLLEKSKAFLGEQCIITIGDSNEASDDNAFQFKGVVTNLQGSRSNIDGELREMVTIRGKSGSIVLENGKDINSSLELTLSDIVTASLGNYDQSLLNTEVAPENDAQINYSVQQQQSKFNYLKQLAATHGEYLLYAGDTLYFGKPDLGEAIELTLGSSLKNVSIGLSTLASKFNYYSNDYFNEAEVAVSTADSAAVASDGFIGFANEVNEKLFPEATKVSLPTFEDAQLEQRTNTAVSLQKKIIEQKQVILTGTAYLPSVSLGKIISIKNNENQYGTYRIINITHRCDDSGKYFNVFSAIPTDIDIYPLTDINAYPRSENQIAKVFDNVDPEGLSRIKVQFPWQVATNQTTPWIRVMTPHSGMDKGFHFIPEVGEEVLIGFEGGNAERPFVMGALYTGVNKPEEWQTDANNMKAIRTRSGHTIELNDTEGEEKIQIYDNEGSVIIFDTQAKSLTINATEDIEIGAKNIRIVAEENIDIQAQGDISKTADGDIMMQSQGNTDIKATGDASLSSDKTLALEAATDTTMKSLNTVIESTEITEMNAINLKLNGSGSANVSGSVVRLN